MKELDLTTLIAICVEKGATIHIHIVGGVISIGIEPNLGVAYGFGDSNVRTPENDAALAEAMQQMAAMTKTHPFRPRVVEDDPPPVAS